MSFAPLLIAVISACGIVLVLAGAAALALSRVVLQSIAVILRAAIRHLARALARAR